MTDYAKFDARKLSLAAVMEIEANDYAKRQIKIARKRQRKRQGKDKKCNK